MNKNKTVEGFIEQHPKWEKELKHLRNLVKQTQLEESIKWGQPTYSLKNKNVFSIGAFKEHFGIWFFNGALLYDPKNHLMNAQKGKTKAMRQLRFTSMEEIDDAVVVDFIHQAIENQKAGKEVNIDLKREAKIPPLMKEAFSEDGVLKKQFNELTPGRQREYAEYIATAKQESTKKRRLQKIIPMIKSSMGLNDKYQK